MTILRFTLFLWEQSFKLTFIKKDILSSHPTFCLVSRINRHLKDSIEMFYYHLSQWKVLKDPADKHGSCGFAVSPWRRNSNVFLSEHYLKTLTFVIGTAAGIKAVRWAADRGVSVTCSSWVITGSCSLLSACFCLVLCSFEVLESSCCVSGYFKTERFNVNLEHCG